MQSNVAAALPRVGAPTFAYGHRGARPVQFHCTSWEATTALHVPGVTRTATGVTCPWDAAWAVAALLHRDPPAHPEPVINGSGLARYKALGLDRVRRQYQAEAAAWLCSRAYGLLAEPPRAGKTLEALIASVLAGWARGLIICPAIAKYVWADEILRWVTDVDVIVLEGRAGNEARVLCRPCRGRGTIDDEPCPACRAKNGQSLGCQILRTRESIVEAMSACAYTIVNYDLLVAQAAKDAAGGGFIREDLPGWGPTLARVHYDGAILDEVHNCRGFSTDRKRRGKTRRERVRDVVRDFTWVWGLTGTPIYGFRRDLWAQLDIISGGLVGSYWDFTARYCQGHRNEHGGWEANGDGPFDAELDRRLASPAGAFLKRPRELILAQMPPKMRRVTHIDPTAGAKIVRPAGASSIAKALRQTAEMKAPMVIENVLSELAAGDKVIVFGMLRANAEKMAKEIAKAIESREHGARMRQVRAQAWLAHGEQDSKIRFELARAFREHKGAAVFVATIDAVQVAVSLNGATSVHFADLHYQPAALLQAEDRPYEPGTTGLVINYYIVKGTVDETVERIVLPKMATLETAMRESGAAAFKNTFADPVEQLAAVWARLTAHISE